MFYSNILRFIVKNNIFIIKCLNPAEINNNYIKELNKNKFVRYNIRKKISISEQINYIENINKSANNIIFGLFNKKVLIGTIGLQKISKKKYYIGIFVFDQIFKNIGLAKFMIKKVGKFMNKKLNIKFLFASVNKKNFISHKLFHSLNFKIHKKIKKRYKSDVLYFININKIKVKI